MKNLALAIDAEIEMATGDGATVQQWYDSQKPDDEKYVSMFWDTLARKNPDYRKKSPVHDGSAVMRAIVVKNANAA